MNAQPLVGVHHCIATGHAIVNMVFRHLQAKCAGHGGMLTDSELADARVDIIADFQYTLDLFEDVHKQCMDAGAVDATMIFAKGRMLSSLLFACTQKTAAYTLSNETNNFDEKFLNRFYDSLSSVIRQYVGRNAEARLASAYVKASCMHGQKLTIHNFLREQTVQNVLQECVLPFEAPEFSGALGARLIDKINGYIGTESGTALGQINTISISQMREFLQRFPDDIRSVLNQPAADSGANV